VEKDDCWIRYKAVHKAESFSKCVHALSCAFDGHLSYGCSALQSSTEIAGNKCRGNVDVWVLQAQFSTTILCKRKQFLSAVLVKYPE
jgi:hypothetical protein